MNLIIITFREEGYFESREMIVMLDKEINNIKPYGQMFFTPMQ